MRERDLGMEFYFGAITGAFMVVAAWLTVRIIKRREPWAIVVAVLMGVVAAIGALSAYLVWLGIDA